MIIFNVCKAQSRHRMSLLILLSFCQQLHKNFPLWNSYICLLQDNWALKVRYQFDFLCLVAYKIIAYTKEVLLPLSLCWFFHKNLFYKNHNPANIYLFKVDNRNTSKRPEIYSKLTISTPVQSRWCLVFLLLTFNIFYIFL